MNHHENHPVVAVRVGYARVSTVEQSLDQQVQRLLDDGVLEENIFEDEAISGEKNADSPHYRAMLDRLKANPGSELVVVRLDRLGRSTKELLAVLELLAEWGCSFRTLDNSLAYRHGNATDKLVLTVLAAIAEFERNLISLRTKEALALKKATLTAEGKRLGRPSKLTEDDIALAFEYEAQGWGVNRIAKRFGVSKPTMLRYLGRTGQGNETPSGRTHAATNRPEGGENDE